MNNDLLNILSESKNIDQQRLLAYLEGKLSPEERHAIEKLLIDSDFDNDAAEGLSQVHDKSKLPLVMNELNRKLVSKLSKRRKKLLKRTPDMIDHGRDGIRVNCICPGYIDAGLAEGYFQSQANPAKARADAGKLHALGRIGKPGEVGRAAVFLASDDASFVTGAALVVDGGFGSGLPSQ